MRKKTETWTVRDLEKRYVTIDFPEYQREPNVWSRSAKQQLIDSIIREFDIASLYLYDTGDESFDCIDGRQRIGAIMGFLGQNKEDQDNEFEWRPANEIYTDDILPYASLEGLAYKNILDASKKKDDARNADARAFLKALTAYELTIVKLSNSREAAEFNLQFTRLNLGTIVNSGEKLNAMVGDMRDLCFKTGQIGDHPFLGGIGIPTRRFSKEQVAAQILAQIFSIEETDNHTRTRHFDLARFFKEHATLDNKEVARVAKIRAMLDLLATAFKNSQVLHNRAITVSTVLLAWKLGLKSKKEVDDFALFIGAFICRLKWQTRKGLDVDKEYRYLIDFQRHVTQASVEKAALDARAKVLEEQRALWSKTKSLAGDAAYLRRTVLDPNAECKTKSN